MLKLVLHRLLNLLPVLWALLTLTFFLTKAIPGGPFAAERKLAPAVIQQLNAHYGYDRPVFEQYGRYLANAIRGDLGPTISYQSETVTEVIGRAFPVSLAIGTLALGIALVVGIPLGTIAAAYQNTIWDYVTMLLAMVGICVPTFVLGPILALTFGIELKLAPVSGWFGANYSFFPPVVLPAMTLGLFYAAYFARLTRGGMLEVIHQDFIRTARAKGLPEIQVIIKHALRGGLLPVASYLGPVFAGLITGSFIVEKIFNVPGLGQEFIKSVGNRDTTLIMGTVLFYGLLIVLFNLVSDLILLVLDPRTRH